ncbi:DUF4259 domain-containing protein [Neptunomonas antarctica]|uniref:DUF4259 domain-containing protein n=1 Tax=Neptunomonas antarctica TaxID=619304 RepID=A0A1N7LKP0_9GAMM|nr:DUF4259 domain-containing protein [Neptunomonas antarctica]SIS74393.1 protein of unknown function [Neptunomonas antarctica]
MGAWGIGVFDDDTSCEVIEDAMDEGLSISELVDQAISSSECKYLEYTECHEIIVAAAMVNSLINKVSYDGIDGLDKWLSKQHLDTVVPFKGKLAAALSRVLGESSELNELWAGNEDDYPTWKANLEAIIHDLSS